MHYLNLEQLQAIVQEVCFIEKEDEAGTMLDFYHDLGMIVRHRNTIVLQAQWLIEVFKQLITIRSFNDMVRSKNFKYIIVSLFSLILWSSSNSLLPPWYTH